MKRCERVCAAEVTKVVFKMCFLKLDQTYSKSSLAPCYSHVKVSAHQLQSNVWLADYSNVLVS